MPGSTRMLAQWRRCSSAAGTPRSRTSARRALRNQLGIAIAKRTYKAAPRSAQLAALAARLQRRRAPAARFCGRAREPRIPTASDILYIKALAAPFTVNTMPEGTLKALAKHSQLGPILPADGGDCEEVWRSLPERASTSMRWPPSLQEEGAKSFVKSWNELMDVIASKSRRCCRKPVRRVAG